MTSLLVIPLTCSVVSSVGVAMTSLLVIPLICSVVSSVGVAMTSLLVIPLTCSVVSSVGIVMMSLLLVIPLTCSIKSLMSGESLLVSIDSLVMGVVTYPITGKVSVRVWLDLLNLA